MAEIVLHKDLIEKCKSGNQEAQYRLYDLYAKGMYNICLRMMKNREDAEDVLQNSFVDVFTKMHQYGYQSTPGAWIKRIVINNCLNQIKKKKIFFEEIDNVGPAIEEEVHIPEQFLQVDKIKSGISQLAPGFRTVLNLYLMEGYDHQEIADILEVSVSTSKTQYSRAKKKLREILIEDDKTNSLLA